MADDRRFLKLIDEIYDAALDSKRWQIVIESLSRTFDCVGGALLQRERQSAELSFIEFGGMDQSVRDAYQRYYSARSVWMPAAFMGTGELVVGHELAPDKRLFEHSEFYNDWLRPQGVYDAIGGVIQRSPESLTVVTVLRAERAGFVTDADKGLFARLMPHVRRAIDIHRRLYGMQLQRDGTLRALDALEVGIALTDRGGRVIFANRVAERILRRGDGLTLIRDRLRASRPDDARTLATLIAGAAKTTLGIGDRPGGMLALPTGTGQLLSVLVSPCPRLGLLEPTAIVFMSEPPGNVHIDEQHVARQYGLTIAEARLLRALVEGQRLNDYADGAGITLNTARTHLKQVFAKTGSKRQAELVRMFVADPVLRLAGVLPRSPHPGF
jgi:DNA-binding CsgD family transcriptional regulator/PAS domain-containing protein